MGEFIKKEIKDSVAGYIVMVAIILAVIVVAGINILIKNNTSIATSSNQNNIEEIEIENEGTENIVAAEIKETNTIKNTKKLTKKEENKVQKENEKKYEEIKKQNNITEDSHKYYIKVNYGAQTVTIYTKDSKGKFTVPVKAMICSTGTYTPTSGVYRTLAKGNWWGLYGDVYGQYATHIYDGILFHSVPYTRKGDRSSLKTSYYNQLGSRVSMGCVRLTVADAKWIYDNCRIGTQVEFYSSSNPGPLGKPSAYKIGGAVPANVRGWDPTDPNPNNPWPKYWRDLKNKEEQNKVTTNEIVNQPVTNTTNETDNNATTNDIPTTNSPVEETTNEQPNNTNTETTNSMDIPTA